MIHTLFFDIGDTLVFDNPPLPQRFLNACRRAALPTDMSLFPLAWQDAEEVALEEYLRGRPFDHPDTQYLAATFALAAMGTHLTVPKWHELAAAFAAETYVRYVQPESPALLNTLRERGFRLGVISDWDNTLRDVLDELDLSHYFEAVITSADVGVTKPDPRLFQAALEKLNVPAQRSLHIGDWHELDVNGALAANMNALLFDHARRAPNAPCPRAETFDTLAAYLLALPAPPIVRPHAFTAHI